MLGTNGFAAPHRPSNLQPQPYIVNPIGEVRLTAMSGSPSFDAVRIDHVAVIVTDVDRARRFYAEVLSLREVQRPESFDFPGAWFQAGADAAGQVIHLLGHPEADPRGRR